MKVWLSLLLLFSAQALHAETRILSGQSEDDVALNITFNGQEILIFGAIESSGDETNDLAIVVEGPRQDVVVARKEKRGPFWFNYSTVPFKNVPSYSAILSTAPLDKIISDEERQIRGIGVRSQIDPEWASNPKKNFIEGLVRYKSQMKQYVTDERGIIFRDGLLFQAQIPLPASILEGQYAINIFLISEQKVVATASEKIFVHRSGVDAWIYDLAHQQSWLYGIISVVLAMAVAIVAKRTVSSFRR